MKYLDLLLTAALSANTVFAADADEAKPLGELPYPAIKHTLKDWVPVERTTEKIVRVEQDVM